MKEERSRKYEVRDVGREIRDTRYGTRIGIQQNIGGFNMDDIVRDTLAEQERKRREETIGKKNEGEQEISQPETPLIMIDRKPLVKSDEHPDCFTFYNVPIDDKPRNTTDDIIPEVRVCKKSELLGVKTLDDWNKNHFLSPSLQTHIGLPDDGQFWCLPTAELLYALIKQARELASTQSGAATFLITFRQDILNRPKGMKYILPGTEPTAILTSTTVEHEWRGNDTICVIADNTCGGWQRLREFELSKEYQGKEFNLDNYIVQIPGHKEYMKNILGLSYPAPTIDAKSVGDILKSVTPARHIKTKAIYPEAHIRTPYFNIREKRVVTFGLDRHGNIIIDATREKETYKGEAIAVYIPQQQATSKNNTGVTP